MSNARAPRPCILPVFHCFSPAHQDVTTHHSRVEFWSNTQSRSRLVRGPEPAQQLSIHLEGNLRSLAFLICELLFRGCLSSSRDFETLQSAEQSSLPMANVIKLNEDLTTVALGKPFRVC